MKYWLLGKNALCDYLVQHAIDEVTYAKGRPWTRVIWDVTAVAWLVGDFTADEIVTAPIPEYDSRYGYGSDRHLMKCVFHVWRDKLFEDLVKRLTSL